MSDLEYYKILQVSNKASMDEIKAAYRHLAKKYHPDVNQGDKKAESQFKKINEAYEVLSDLAKRAEYDYMAKIKADKKNQKDKMPFHHSATNTNYYNTYRVPFFRMMLWRRVCVLLMFCVYIIIVYQNHDANRPFDFLNAIQNTSIKMNNMIVLSKNEIIKYYDSRQWLKPIWKYIVWSDDIKMAEKVLNYHPSCDFFNDKGYNLLMQTDNVEIANALLDVGCDVNYQATNGETAYSLAIKNNNEQLRELFRKKGAKFPWKKVLPK